METLAAFLWPIAEILLPIVLTILAPLVVALIVKAFQKLGLDVEALNRDALQQAITKGALEAVTRAGRPAVATRVGQAAIRAGVDQVMTSVPDAIKTFKVPREEIAKRVEAQATAIVQTTPTVVPEIVGTAGHAAIDAGLGRLLRAPAAGTAA